MFGPRTVIIGLVAGTAVTVIAALSPARKAGKVAPIAAMQDAVATSTGYGSKQRVFAGTGVLVLGAAVLFTGLLAHPSSPVRPGGPSLRLQSMTFRAGTWPARQPRSGPWNQTELR